MSLTQEIEKALSTTGEWSRGNIRIFRDGDYQFIDAVEPKNMKGSSLKKLFALKKEFDEVRSQLPPGVYGLNPDTPQKQLIYEGRFFKRDPNVRLSGDVPMKNIGREGFEMFIPPRGSRIAKNKAAAAAGFTTYMDHDGRVFGPYEGRAYRDIESRRRSQRRGGSRSKSQLRKEQTRRARKAGFDQTLTDWDRQLLDNLDEMRRNPASPVYGWEIDHIYDLALYDDTVNLRQMGASGEALQLLPKAENIQKFRDTVKMQEGLGLLELKNPSKSLNPTDFQKSLQSNKKLYRALFGTTALGKVARAIPVIGFPLDVHAAHTSTQELLKDPTNTLKQTRAAADVASVVAQDPYSGLVSLGTDIWEHREAIGRAIGTKLTDDKGISRLWYRPPNSK